MSREDKSQQGSNAPSYSPDDLNTAAHFVRGLSEFRTLDAVLLPFERRVEVFPGLELVEKLQGLHKAKGAKKTPALMELQSKDDVIRYCNALLSSQKFFLPVERTDKNSGWMPKKGKMLTVKLDDSQKSFSEQSFYVWLIEPSQTTALIKAISLVVGVLAITCIRIWPVWLRIALFWISLFLLATMILMHALHVASYFFFFLIGLRGVYFLPNLYDDEVGLLESFSPLFGRGGEHQARWRYEQEVLRAKLAGLPPPPELEEPSIWTSWRFTTIQAIVVLIVCFTTCNYLGLFKPENVPSFVISPREMYEMFPSLTPPDWVDDEDMLAKKAQEARDEGY